MIAIRRPVVLISKIEIAFIDIPMDYGEFWRADFVVDSVPVEGVLFFRRDRRVQVLVPVGSSELSLSQYTQKTIARKFKKAVKHLEREE